MNPTHILALAGLSILAVVTPPVPVPVEILEMDRSRLFAVTASFEHFSQGYTAHPDTNAIDWVRRERRDALDDEKASKNSYTTSFRITAVASREGGDVVYVAGMEDDGTDVLEQWTFDIRDGRWIHRKSGSTPPIGTSAGPYTATTSIKGDEYVDPPERHGAPERRKLWESETFGHIRWMVADPEGRYLLLQSNASSDVYRADLSAVTLSPTLVVTATQQPALSLVRRARIGVHSPTGHRIVVLSQKPIQHNPTTTEYVLLKSPANDGVFAAETLTYAAFKLAYPTVGQETWSFPWLESTAP